MLAFVLSGGGNRGAIQVGALQVLLEAGIKPDLVVGTSVGAVNGAALALDPTVRATYELASTWRAVTRDDVYPGNRLTPVWNFLRGREGLFSNQAWHAFLTSVFHAKTFGDIQACQARVVATDLATGALVTFGGDPTLPIVDALMASTALPPLHPPWTIRGRRYIDGGAVADLPVRVALELGARTIFALKIAGPLPAAGQIRNTVAVARQAVSALIHQQMSFDLEQTRRSKGVWLHELTLPVDLAFPPWDFSHTDELIDMGREAAQTFLASTPLPPRGLKARLAAGLSRITVPVWATSLAPAPARRLRSHPGDGEGVLNG